MNEREYRERFLRTLDGIYGITTVGARQWEHEGVTVFFESSETRASGLTIAFGVTPLVGGAMTPGEVVEIDWQGNEADSDVSARRFANGPLRKYFPPNRFGRS
jgi:hypothetical protein